MARPPFRRRPQPRLEQLRNFAFGREAVEPVLAEHLLTVDGDLKPPVAPRLQLDATNDRSPAAQDLLRQAHGLVEVVSRDAEFDRDLGFGAGHL